MRAARGIILVGTGLSAAAALAAVSAPVELELPRDADVTIVGPSFAAGFPRSTHVDAVGDVNGDRRPDLLVANHQGHGGDAARSYVVFGGTCRRASPCRRSARAVSVRPTSPSRQGT